MTEIHPVQLAGELEALKAQFTENMMGDPLIGDILRARLRRDPSILKDFPEFEMEPTLSANDDGSVAAGISIMHARSYRDPWAISKLRIIDNLPLAIYPHVNSSSMDLTANFADELHRIGVNPSGTEPAETMQRWQANWRSLRQVMQGDTQIDPIYHNIELTRVVEERPSYQKTHGLSQTDLPPYDFENLVGQYDWMTNVPVPEDRAGYMELLRTYIGLMSTKGAGNVRYSLGAFDSHSGYITRVPGQIGIYVRKGSKVTIPFNFAFSVTPNT